MPNLFTPGFNILRTGDFNGDGKADLIVYNSQTRSRYIGFGKGDGTFNFQSLFWSPGYDTVVTGDINGDGKTDVALYNSTTGTHLHRHQQWRRYVHVQIPPDQLRLHLPAIGGLQRRRQSRTVSCTAPRTAWRTWVSATERGVHVQSLVHQPRLQSGRYAAI